MSGAIAKYEYALSTGDHRARGGQGEFARDMPFARFALFNPGTRGQGVIRRHWAYEDGCESADYGGFAVQIDDLPKHFIENACSPPTVGNAGATLMMRGTGELKMRHPFSVEMHGGHAQSALARSGTAVAKRGLAFAAWLRFVWIVHTKVRRVARWPANR